MISEQLKKTFVSKQDCLSDIIGQEQAKKQLKSAILMDRHIIIVGPPGIGKTTLAKNVAMLLPDKDLVECSYNCSPENPICPECISNLKVKKKLDIKKIKGQKRFVRIQGSPDLTAEDLIGDIDPIKAMKFGPLSLEAFTPGKIFRANNGILFFDEVNRCPEKLQNALLQVLEEKKATIGSYNIDIDADFIFIGTMNPKDSSTEKLSDVFLDRFDMVYMDYPENDKIETEIIIKKGKKIADFPENLLKMVVAFIRSLRHDEKLEKFPSVRASLGIYERAQSNAVINSRNTVCFNDIKDVVVSVLSHRIKLKPSTKYLINPKKYIEEEFEKFVDLKYSELRLQSKQSKKGGCP
ncbi:MAG: ATP-binding protein [Candidatus Nanoarchaeia archaeon]|nr:ATP-binding protein [Candidatus Nanoarchaeia archaeon]